MVSKRALNFATKRYNMVTYVLKSCSSRHFNDVHVMDICRATGISKVTFFKYFKQKEDILLYYKSLLTLSLTIQARHKNLQGIDGLQKIVAHFSLEFRERPSLVLGLINKLTSDTIHRPLRISPAEKNMFYPNMDFDEIEVLSLEQMIDKFMLEAVFESQVRSSGDAKDLGVLFLSTLYGAIVESHVRGDSGDRMLFQNTMRGFLYLI